MGLLTLLDRIEGMSSRLSDCEGGCSGEIAVKVRILLLADLLPAIFLDLSQEDEATNLLWKNIKVCWHVELPESGNYRNFHIIPPK